MLAVLHIHLWWRYLKGLWCSGLCGLDLHLLLPVSDLHGKEFDLIFTLFCMQNQQKRSFLFHTVHIKRECRLCFSASFCSLFDVITDVIVIVIMLLLCLSIFLTAPPKKRAVWELCKHTEFACLSPPISLPSGFMHAARHHYSHLDHSLSWRFLSWSSPHTSQVFTTAIGLSHNDWPAQ